MFKDVTLEAVPATLSATVSERRQRLPGRAHRGPFGRGLALAAALTVAATLHCRPVGAQVCVGDCDSNGLVSVNELVTGINVALGVYDPERCANFVSFTVQEIVAGVGNALHGCTNFACPLGEIEGCEGGCYPSEWLADGVCDAQLNCPSSSHDNGDCSAPSCPAADVLGCDGNCHPSSDLGDGECDEAFNCPTLLNDNGDCTVQHFVRDFPVFEHDGAGVGEHRDCTPTKDCTPTRDCTPTQDCTPTRNCDIKCSKDTRNCKKCLVKNPFGGCWVRGNDPICEAAKAAQNAIYQAKCKARKLDCERIKSQEKLTCEAEKSAWKLDCERVKTQEKVQCEAEKTAAKLDCERLKETQKLASEPVEAAIHYSRQIALGENPRPIPSRIRQALYPYFTPQLLDSVLWTDDHGNIFTLQKFITELATRNAVTLGSVIVFKSADRASWDVGLWAHELEHVKQYDLLGIDGFAQYYTFEYGLIESLAGDQSQYVCQQIGPTCVSNH